MNQTHPTARHTVLRIAAIAILFAGAPALAARSAAAAPSAPVIALPLQPVVAADLRSCQTRTQSGLGYSVLKPAEGAKPAASDAVLVNYIGYLATTGATFDQNMRSAFMVENVVAGFSEGLRLMPKGSIYRFCIPAALGYGAKEQGPIPANSDLVFQVEMVDFKTTAELEAIRKTQEAAQAAQQATPKK